MAHDEQVLVAYLCGELDPTAAERCERHLVDCDQCWAAVAEDFQGRAAAETLRELAPRSSRDRIRFAVEGEKGPARRNTRRSGRAAAALAMVLIAGAVIATMNRVGGHRPSGDPAAVAAVVRVAGRGSVVGATLHSQLTAGGQVITLTHFDDGGVPIVVARSDRSFPTPGDATPMLRVDSPWIASRGALTLICFNHPHPVLFAARLPADQLMGLAAHLLR
jgi:hypothetical protein